MPVIDGAVASLIVANRSQHIEGDHVIFVGEVVTYDAPGGPRADLPRRPLHRERHRRAAAEGLQQALALSAARARTGWLVVPDTRTIASCTVAT